jgi:hypothetical protein
MGWRRLTRLALLVVALGLAAGIALTGCDQNVGGLGEIDSGVGPDTTMEEGGRGGGTGSDGGPLAIMLKGRGGPLPQAQPDAGAPDATPPQADAGNEPVAQDAQPEAVPWPDAGSDAVVGACVGGTAYCQTPGAACNPGSACMRYGFGTCTCTGGKYVCSCP